MQFKKVLLVIVLGILAIAVFSSVSAPTGSAAVNGVCKVGEVLSVPAGTLGFKYAGAPAPIMKTINDSTITVVDCDGLWVQSTKMILSSPIAQVNSINAVYWFKLVDLHLVQ